MEQEAKPRPRCRADGACHDDLSRSISFEFMPTLSDLLAAEIDERFGVIIPADDPDRWMTVTPHLPPRGAPRWAIGSRKYSSSYHSLEQAISGAFRKVEHFRKNGEATGVTISAPLQVHEKTVWAAIVIVPVMDRSPRWSALAVTKIGTWHPIITRSSRNICVAAALDFCKHRGFCGLITVYPLPAAQT